MARVSLSSISTSTEAKMVKQTGRIPREGNGVPCYITGSDDTTTTTTTTASGTWLYRSQRAVLHCNNMQAAENVILMIQTGYLSTCVT